MIRAKYDQVKLHHAAVTDCGQTIGAVYVDRFQPFWHSTKPGENIMDPYFHLYWVI